MLGSGVVVLGLVVVVIATERVVALVVVVSERSQIFIQSL